EMQMKNLFYLTDAYNFWVEAIEYSQTNEKSMDKKVKAKKQHLYSTDDIHGLREATVNPSLFKPSFFCPDAFKLSKVANSSVLDSVSRICRAGEGQMKKSAAALVGPLALLAQCNEEDKKLPGNVDKQLAQLGRAYKGCNMAALIVVTAGTVSECRPDFDHFNHDA
ncbi:hypothetical protein PFISCL1PPCAC_6760, partial [Pristionchus fissidentatus]